MIVISDTSPLCYLLLIDLIDLLPEFYDLVLIPAKVRDELADLNSPSLVQHWISQPPTWLMIRSVELSEDLTSNELDAGEREAIALAKERQADLILLDDQAARVLAIQQGLAVVGILGILVKAGQQGKIDFPATIAQLQKTNFRASAKLIQSLIDQFESS
jgi:predicted nucleic acid-binding protein